MIQADCLDGVSNRSTVIHFEEGEYTMYDLRYEAALELDAQEEDIILTIRTY